MSSFYHFDEEDHPYLGVQSSSILFEQAVHSALSEPTVDSDVRVGLFGCGWVGGLQLDAYARAGIEVVALHDRTEAKARSLRDRYFPDATVCSTAEEFFTSPWFSVADIATHVDGRPALIERALRSGKHVLSQKPFVQDLAEGQRLADLAAVEQRVLAVNQNGRWAPHFGAMLALVRAGLIGAVTSADFEVCWPHDVVVEAMPAFASMADLVMYDFGAHWFDIVGLLAPLEEVQVYACAARRSGQLISAPTQAQAIVSADGFSSSLVFRAAERHMEWSRYRISGTRGVITHEGKHLGGHEVHVATDDGEAQIAISNNWFRHGMRGTMVEVLRAIGAEGGPSNSAQSALRGLSLCFAATTSARTGKVELAGQHVTR